MESELFSSAIFLTNMLSSVNSRSGLLSSATHCFFQQAFHATSVIRHMRQLKLNSSNNASNNESATTPTNQPIRSRKALFIDQSKSMLFVIYSISILLARGMMTHSMSNSSRETQKWQPLDGNVVQCLVIHVQCGNIETP